MYKGKIYLIMALLFSLLAGGGIYKFNATSISPDVKTISIYTIENRAMKVNPSLSNQITEALQDKFRKLTKLDAVTDRGL